MQGNAEGVSTPLDEILRLDYGQGLPEAARATGPFPVVGSAGIVGHNAQALVAGPGIIVGRKGNAGSVIWSSEDFWPIDTTFYVAPRRDLHLRWLFWALKYARLGQLNAATGVPSLLRDHAYAHRIFVPERRSQERIAEALDANADAEQAARRVLAKLRWLKKGVVRDLLRFDSTKTIDEIATHVGSGVTPRGGSTVYRREGVKLLRSQNVHFEGLRLDEVAYIDQATHRSMSRSEVFADDVLLNITGASIGRCCALPAGLGLANVNQHVCAIRVRDGGSNDAVFLAELLASDIGQLQIDRLNAGGSREGLNYQQVRALVVPWPDRDQRLRVAEVASSLNLRIQLQRREAEKHEMIRDGIARDLLTATVLPEPALALQSAEASESF